MVCRFSGSRSHGGTAQRVTDEERLHALLPGRSGLVSEAQLGPPFWGSPALTARSVSLEMQTVHALKGVDLFVGEALTDGSVRDAEPDRDH